eukprot:365719_1
MLSLTLITSTCFIIVNLFVSVANSSSIHRTLLGYGLQEIARDLGMDASIVSWFIGDIIDSAGSFEQIDPDFLGFLPSDSWSIIKNTMSHADKSQLKELNAFMEASLGRLSEMYPDRNKRSMHPFWKARDPHQAIKILSSVFGVPIPEMFRVFNWNVRILEKEAADIQIRHSLGQYLRVQLNPESVSGNGEGSFDPFAAIWRVHLVPAHECQDIGSGQICVTLQTITKQDKSFLQIINGKSARVTGNGDDTCHFIVHKHEDQNRVRFESKVWRGRFLGISPLPDHTIDIVVIYGEQLEQKKDMTWFCGYILDQHIHKYEQIRGMSLEDALEVLEAEEHQPTQRERFPGGAAGAAEPAGMDLNTFADDMNIDIALRKSMENEQKRAFAASMEEEDRTRERPKDTLD